MNKKFEIIKNIQLVLYIIFAGLAIFYFVLDSDFATVIGSSRQAHTVAIALWGFVAISFVFIFIDLTIAAYSNKNLKEVFSGLYSDKVTRVNNRISVDAFIEGYKDKVLPANMCCVLFSLHSLEITNVKHDRKRGDKHIKAFSDILGLSSLDKSFVGRNGGGDFLVFFEDTKEEDLSNFFDRVEELVLNHNKIFDDSWIRYRYGVAYNQNSGFTHIGDLIHKAYEKCKSSEIVPNPEGNFK